VSKGQKVEKIIIRRCQLSAGEQAMAGQAKAPATAEALADRRKHERPKTRKKLATDTHRQSRRFRIQLDRLTFPRSGSSILHGRIEQWDNALKNNELVHYVLKGLIPIC